MPVNQADKPKVSKPQGQDGFNGLPDFSILNYSHIPRTATKAKFSTVIKRLIKWGILIGILTWLYFHYFAYWDISRGCKVSIYPSWSQFNNRTVILGIRYLKQDYPENYFDFCNHVTAINPNLSCGGAGGGCYSAFQVSPGTIDISTFPGDVKAAAGVIAHETCHARQYAENRSFNETECYQISDKIIYGKNMH